MISIRLKTLYLLLFFSILSFFSSFSYAQSLKTTPQGEVCDYRAFAQAVKLEAKNLRFQYLSEKVNSVISIPGILRSERIEEDANKIFKKFPNFKKAIDFYPDIQTKLLAVEEIYRDQKNILIQSMKSNPETSALIALVQQEKLDFLPFEIASEMRSIVGRKKILKEYVETQEMLKQKRGIASYGYKHPEEIFYTTKNLVNTFIGEPVRQTWKDYIAAWESRTSLPGKIYQLSKRLLIAPRSSHTDPALKEAELKKFNWLTAIMDPIIDAPIEILSKAKQIQGGHLGISSKPLGHRASFPLSIPLGIYSWMEIKNWHEKQYKNQKKEALLGLPYLEPFRAIQLIEDGEAVLKLREEHSSIIHRWFSDHQNPNITHLRHNLPRILQLQIEGVLRGDEVDDFQQLVLNSLIETEKLALKEPKAKRKEFLYDSIFKKMLLEMLTKHPVLHKKSAIEKQLLLLVLDPPLLFNKPEESLSWYSKVNTLLVVDKKPQEAKKYYVENIRSHSDIFWYKLFLEAQEKQKHSPESLTAPEKSMLAYSESLTEDAKDTQKNSTTASGILSEKVIPESQPTNNIVLPATLYMFYVSHGLKDSKEKLIAKHKKGESIQNFPPEKLEYLSARADHPLWLNGVDNEIKSLDKSKKYEIKDEFDHWNILLNHPQFLKIAEEWKAKTISDHEAFSLYKKRLRFVNTIAEWQQLKLSERKNSKDLPALSIPEVCMIQNNPMLLQQFELFAFKRMIIANQITQCILKAQEQAAHKTESDTTTGISEAQFKLIDVCSLELEKDKFSQESQQKCAKILQNTSLPEINSCIATVEKDQNSRNVCSFLLTNLQWQQFEMSDKFWQEKLSRNDAVIKLSEFFNDEFEQISNECLQENFHKQMIRGSDFTLEKLYNHLLCPEEEKNQPPPTEF